MTLQAGVRIWWCLVLFATGAFSLAIAAELTAQDHGQEPVAKLVVQLGHGRSISSVAFSPGGQQVLTGSWDQTAILWDVATGQRLRTFQGHKEEVAHVAFSPSGKQVLTGSIDGEAILWDAQTGGTIRTFTGRQRSSFAFSPDGKSILTGAGIEVMKVWDAGTGAEVLALRGASGPVAFSPDSKRILTGGGDDKTAKVWDAETGAEVLAIRGHTHSVITVAWSPDGKRILTGGEGNGTEGKPLPGEAKVWDAATGAEFLALKGHAGRVNSAVFSPDGRRILTGSDDKTAKVWDAEKGTDLLTLKGHAAYVFGVAFGPNGKQVLTGSYDRTAILWEAASGKILRILKGEAKPVVSVAFSPNRQKLIAGSETGIVWDLATGGKSQELRGHSAGFDSLVFSPDGRLALTGSGRNTMGTGGDKAAYLWDVASGKRLRFFQGPDREITSLAYSQDGRQILTVSGNRTAILWEADSGKKIHTFQMAADGISAAEFSPDGKYLATASYGGMIVLWATSTARQIQTYWMPCDIVCSVAFSPDGTQLLTGCVGGWSTLWDVTTGRMLRVVCEFPSTAKLGILLMLLGAGQVEPVQCGAILLGYASVALDYLWYRRAGRWDRVAFSPDGKRLLTMYTPTQGPAVWDAATGNKLHGLQGCDPWTYAVQYSSDGKYIVTGSGDATTRLWDHASGKELCRLVSFQNGSWLVVDPLGRFDTDNLDAVRGAHWVAQDDPFRPLPVEIFLRDYYEPRLLARILAGESFNPIRSLAELNRAQPSVTVKSVEPQPGQLDEVVVTIEVADQASTLTRGGKQVALHSGVFDVHLFRDGQLVGRHPATDGPVRLKPDTDRTTLRFEHVRLPRNPGVKEVEFSAYAFNADRVKSPTHVLKYAVPVDLAPRKGVAYVVCVGVNAFDDSARDLRFAVPDANALADTVRASLVRSGHFDRVVVVRLLSDWRSDGGRRVVTVNDATKGNVRAVLARLAGERIDADDPRRLPGAVDLAPARPEDLVLVSFSTHGANGPGGRFYLFPSDIGPNRDEPADAPLPRCISTDDLSAWLRDVDAGETVMVVDACHSAGTVEQVGFKPGPMGSRGLGQLAYDKRMRILAASQAADVAFEHEKIGHGLLTYALCREGLQGGKADFAPADGKVTLAEWLKYGERRVPELAEEIAAGKLGARSWTGRDLQTPLADRDMIFRQGTRSIAQRPALFDFTRGRGGVILRGD